MLATAVTSAPSALAIWTANVPMPPEAPLTRTVWPARTLPWSRMAWRATRPAIGTVAACSKVRLAGFRASSSSDAAAYSAYEPVDAPKTSSPGLNRVTALPTAATCPATSVPRTPIFGLRRPYTGRAMYGSPLITAQSAGLTPAARTRTSTSWSPIRGRSTCSEFERLAGAVVVLDDRQHRITSLSGRQRS